jgi:Mrp family chromosome partitioning ATPase
MEHIRKAVERAKSPLSPSEPCPDLDGSLGSNPGSNPGSHSGVPQDAARAARAASAKDDKLDAAHLESRRIIAHDILDPRSRSFDMLRTQVLQSMDMKSWQFLGATSATEGCGKSVVSVNLALSIARQPERSVLLVDLDLQKPQVASCLGIGSERGLLSVLHGRASLQNALVPARIKNCEMVVLPCEAPTLNSSEWIASREMRSLLTDIKRDFRGWTVVFDLPPLLASDDVISILPQLDCVLFVVGAGKTTAEEIKECNRHLESAEVVRVVLNKAEDATTPYYAPPRFEPKPPPQNKSGGSGAMKPVSKLIKKIKEL